MQQVWEFFYVWKFVCSRGKIGRNTTVTTDLSESAFNWALKTHLFSAAWRH